MLRCGVAGLAVALAVAPRRVALVTCGRLAEICASRLAQACDYTVDLDRVRVAFAITQAALTRRESIGAHYRADASGVTATHA